MTPQTSLCATDPGFYRKVLDAIPLPVFVVDEDVRIHDYNKAAEPLLGPDHSISFRRRGGEVLHCLHSVDVPEGCGCGPLCKDCVLRNSVTRAFQGEKVGRTRTHMQLVSKGKLTEAYLLVSAAPLDLDERRLVLLTLEDIKEMVTLESLLPICMGCKKVRKDKDYWQTIEQYLETHLDIDLSHGLCPDCLEHTKQEWRAAKARSGR